MTIQQYLQKRREEFEKKFINQNIKINSTLWIQHADSVKKVLDFNTETANTLIEVVKETIENKKEKYQIDGGNENTHPLDVIDEIHALEDDFMIHEHVIKHVKSCSTCRTTIWQYILKEKLTLDD